MRFVGGYIVWMCVLVLAETMLFLFGQEILLFFFGREFFFGKYLLMLVILVVALIILWGMIKAGIASTEQQHRTKILLAPLRRR